MLSLKTIANQCFGVPFEGGPGVPKASFGGTELSISNTADPGLNIGAPKV